MPSSGGRHKRAGIAYRPNQAAVGKLLAAGIFQLVRQITHCVISERVTQREHTMTDGDDPPGAPRPQGTVVIVAVFGALVVIGWLLMFFGLFVPRATP